jgi:hypothetical protein
MSREKGLLHLFPAGAELLRFSRLRNRSKGRTSRTGYSHFSGLSTTDRGRGADVGRFVP